MSRRIDGARHLDPAVTNSPAERFEMKLGATVRVVISDDAAATVTGQQTAWVATNLLVRIVKVIENIEFVGGTATDIAAGIDLYEGGDGTLAETLAISAGAIAGDQVGVKIGMTGDPVDVALVIGRADPGPARNVVYATARRWTAWVGSRPPETTFNDEPGAIGGYLAASLGVAEVFKHAAALRQGRLFHSFALSAWSRSSSTGSIADIHEIGPMTTGVHLGDIHVAGAGAVTHAFIALLRAVGVSGRAIVVDGDIIDDKNLNRYLLATLEDIGAIKCRLAAGQLRAAGLEAYPVIGKWGDYMTGKVTGEKVPTDLDENVKASRFDTVLSFVDNNPARHSVQNAWPRRLLGASTPGLALQVHDYDIASGGQCLKCANPLPKTDTVEDVAAKLLGLPPQERLARGLEAGLSRQQVAELSESNCAVLGSIDRRRLNVPLPEFSVSFVSAAAGFLAAAATLRAGADYPFTPASEGQSTYFGFYQPDIDVRSHKPNEACDCRTNGLAVHQLLWGAGNP